MRFSLTRFYNFIESHRQLQQFTTTKFSKLAMPDSPNSRYPTYRNERIGSSFVIFSSLKALGFTTIILRMKTNDNITYKGTVDITRPLQDINMQLIETAKAFADTLTYGTKVAVLGQSYHNLYISKSVPTFTTFTKVFERLNVEVEITKPENKNENTKTEDV